MSEDEQKVLDVLLDEPQDFALRLLKLPDAQKTWERLVHMPRPTLLRALGMEWQTWGELHHGGWVGQE